MPDIPNDLIEVGRVGEPFGVKGWVNVFPHSVTADALLKAKSWWLGLYTADTSASLAAPREFSIAQRKVHSDRLVVHFMGIEERDAAERLKGSTVWVSRSFFPRAAEDEYYWVDLLGCEVINRQSQSLGMVREVVDHGAHPILVIPATAPGADSIMIPFVGVYIDSVDLPAKRILVDWEHDF